MQAQADEWDSFAPWAASVRHMLEYFEDYTYFGPDSEVRIEAATEATTTPFTNFADWAMKNVQPGF